MKKAVWVLIPMIAVALLSAGSTFAQEAQKPAEADKVVATVGPDGVQRVAILGGGYFYKPSYIIVKVNVPVEFTLTKEAGFTPHDFVIQAPDAGIVVSESMDTKPKVVKFTPTKVGKYPIFCSKKAPFSKSHREKGMEGMLEVQ